MDRRDALRRVGAALAVAGAGCVARRGTGPRTPPPPGERERTPEGSDLAVTDISPAEADGGHLRIDATVENRGTEARTATLALTVTVDEESVERTREVTVGGGNERTVGVDFESVSYEAFASGGSVSPELR
jgi:hypothetical protein